MLRKMVLALVLAGILIGGGYYTERVEARAATAASAARLHPATPAAATPPPAPVAAPVATPIPAPPRSTAQLQAEVVQLAQAAGANVGVSLFELGGSAPLSWNYQGYTPFVAASTYKLPVLMDEAQLLAAGAIHTGDTLCYEDADWEDGWFSDYADGDCYTRQQLASRVGQESDNTSAHMLVDSIGGGTALNSYAAAHGAGESAFYYPNTTTANDLVRLWVNEASGQAGGAAAQQWLYPLLTSTAYEAGIPAGTPAGTVVVHKIGILDSEVNDAALVTNGPKGAYVLVVMTDGPGGTSGWQLAADISRAVWQFEAERS